MAAAGSAAGACGVDPFDRASGGSGAPPSLRIWAHQGQEAENAALRAVVTAFASTGESRVRVELSCFPDHHYTERLSIAAAAGDMPDVFEVDGPLVARFVQAGLLAPLDRFVTTADLDDFLPTIVAQGTVGGRLYALGAFDSAAVIYFDRGYFERAGVIPPAAGVGFSWSELMEACALLSRRGRPISLHMEESADEWYTYAFSPLLWSAGGRLIDVSGTRVAGVLASAVNVSSLRAWQALFERGYASASPVDPDPFGHGSVAMDWSGHWMARSHLANKGAALGVMGLPRVGPVASSPCGSYCWGMFSGCERPELAAGWIDWVTGATTGVLPLVAANGAVPARRSAFSAFPEYTRPPYSLFRDLLEHGARPRPRTPYYATLTREFAAALRDIARGAPVEPRLKRAEAEVQLAIDRRLGFSHGRAG
jgi:ABC-type glycerol-3-phosphate transport system substrate-binding protein